MHPRFAGEGTAAREVPGQDGAATDAAANAAQVDGDGDEIQAEAETGRMDPGFGGLRDRWRQLLDENDFAGVRALLERELPELKKS